MILLVIPPLVASAVCPLLKFKVQNYLKWLYVTVCQCYVKCYIAVTLLFHRVDCQASVAQDEREPLLRRLATVVVAVLYEVVAQCLAYAYQMVYVDALSPKDVIDVLAVAADTRREVGDGDAPLVQDALNLMPDMYIFPGRHCNKNKNRKLNLSVPEVQQ